MSGDSDNHQESFKEEARELLAELETSLLELEKRPHDDELIGRVFRALHTIKGTGAMFGFERICSFTHEVESMFDLVRKGSLGVSRELIDLTLAARDHIRLLLDNDQEQDNANGRSIIAAVRQLVPRRPEKAASTPPPQAPSGNFRTGSAVGEILCKVHFQPDRNIAVRGMDPLGALRELSRLGRCTVTAHAAEVPSLPELQAESCYLSWDVLLATTEKIEAVREALLFVSEDSEVKIELVDGPGGPVRAAQAERRRGKDRREHNQGEDGGASIRVSSDKLDKLVDLVGELVTLQSLLSQTAGMFKKTKIPAIAEAVERLTAELRETTMDIRMVPIGSTFAGFQRLVRDLSLELGKEIELETDGSETELDKTVIDRLGDPLVHILRNSIDHGIENPEERQASNKHRTGAIRLSAQHSGAHVLVQVSDDGRGLDPEAIRAKALENGLLAVDAKPTDQELYALIFAPGFSTAKTVTSVSGRGVGMDVVKRAIDTLRGSIEIRSRKGSGTTITLKLPLTLAIIEGLLVRIGAESFIMPLSLVEECVELKQEDRENARGRDLALVRGKVVPYIRLREQFQITGERPSREQIVIVSLDGTRTGFVVDRVVGEHQTVIKNLGGMYKDIEGISGATILGDGAVALILDASRLIQRMEQEATLMRNQCI